MNPSDLERIKDAYERGLAHGQRIERKDIDGYLLRSIFAFGVEVGVARGRELGREQAGRDYKRSKASR